MRWAGVDVGAKMLGVGWGPSAKAACQARNANTKHQLFRNNEIYLRHFASIDSRLPSPRQDGS